MRLACVRLGALLMICSVLGACDSKPSTPANTAPANTSANTNKAAGGGGGVPKDLGPM